MDVPIRPGDVLAQPTRARLFTLLTEFRHPAATEELAESVGLHPNGVRTHLERLREAGLVRRERERQARGRPRDTWTISPGARPGGDPPTGYAQLSRWLVRSLAGGRTRVRDVEAMGRVIGRELTNEGGAGDDEQQLYDVLVSLGFEPERQPVSGGRLTYRLLNCPYRDAVRERQPLVCGLHRGLTRGMLDTIDPKTKLVAFDPKNPDTAGCLIELSGRMVAQAAERQSSDAQHGGEAEQHDAE